ncbi:MAG: AMP-binding protein, partial [Armatimonadetes bacterium]|nr:AMP-binding protein [Anaerolineae bacterium]
MATIAEAPPSVSGTIYEYPNSGYDAVPALPADADTIPKAFVKNARLYSTRTAMRKKRYGLWQAYTWAQSLERVQHFALGLVSLGLTPGDKVCIIGENDPEFYWAEIATQCARGVSIAIFADANPQELAYVVVDSDSVFLVAHDQEQVDKALELRAKFPKIRKVIYWDERGLWNYQDDWLISFEQVEQLGRAYAQQHPTHFDELVAQSKSSDVAIFSYTSGTSGSPKGAIVTHNNLLYATWHTQHTIPVYYTDEYVSFSPLAWITEQGFGVANHARVGFAVSFPEGAETVQNDIREVAPNSLLFPSRIWENLARIMQMRVNDSGRLNRMLYRVFMPVAYRVIDLEDEGKTVPLQWRLLRTLGDIAVLQPLRDKIGTTRMRNAFS